jgi:hypothetical protein
VLSTPHYPNLEQLAQLISRPLRRIREERQFAIEYFGENDLAAGHHRRRSSRQPPDLAVDAAADDYVPHVLHRQAKRRLRQIADGLGTRHH